MYRRSYDYTITPEKKEDFMKHINDYLEEYPYYVHDNDYPYDMCCNKKVEVEHITYFYRDIVGLYRVINKWVQDWYTVQINSTEHQSIPEIQHLHFIKIIDE